MGDKNLGDLAYAARAKIASRIILLCKRLLDKKIHTYILPKFMYGLCKAFFSPISSPRQCLPCGPITMHIPETSAIFSQFTKDISRNVIFTIVTSLFLTQLLRWLKHLSNRLTSIMISCATDVSYFDFKLVIETYLVALWSLQSRSILKSTSKF